MKVELENGLRFVSNFRYNAKPTLSAEPLSDKLLMFADIHSGDYGSFDSDCSNTMVGFVQSIPSITGEHYSLTDHKASCFFGKLDAPAEIETTSTGGDAESKFARITNHNKGV
jgi:hypothetical protein